MKHPVKFVRLLQMLRFPIIIALHIGMLLWTVNAMNRVADGVDQRLFYSGRLEESARLETEANRFFETAELYAQGEPEVTADQVNLALNLFWSRAQVMATPSFVEAIENQSDPKLIPEIVASLPEFDKGVQALRQGDEKSFAIIDNLRRKYSQRIAAFGELAWNARQQRMAKGVEMGLSSISALRWIQTAFVLASILATLYVLFELFVSRRMNRKLNRLVEEKQRMLRTDQLTGISNRFHFEEEITARMEAGDDNFAVIYLDLDGFKQVNDTHGHAVGDDLLRHVAGCLRIPAAAGDTAARFGGDEFAVLVRGDLAHATAYGEAVLAELGKPSGLQPRLPISASVGLCHAGHMESDCTPDGVKRAADVALYAAKAAGRNCLRVFSPDMLATFERRLVLDTDITAAIAGGQLDVVYQPVIGLEDGMVRSVEALVRWQHPKLGAIPAPEIVESAERCQEIQALTLHVLRQALAFHKRLRSLGYEISVSVNVTPSLFALATFGPAVAALLSEYEVRAGQLYLEVTEDSQLPDCPELEDNMRILSLAGALLAVDDFGKAFSNVLRLTALDFRILKIDKVLTDPVAHSERARQVVSSTERMAFALGAETICEGVETANQADALRNAGIAFAQGFHFARPMPAAAMEAFMGSRSGGSGNRHGE